MDTRVDTFDHVEGEAVGGRWLDVREHADRASCRSERVQKCRRGSSRAARAASSMPCASSRLTTAALQARPGEQLRLRLPVRGHVAVIVEMVHA